MLKEVLETWKSIFSNWKYVALALIFGFLFYEFNVFSANWVTIPSFYQTSGFVKTAKLALTLTTGFRETIQLHSYISLILLSFLFGLLFSLITYKTAKIKTTLEGGALTSIGIFLGVLAPGCAACGIGLLSLLGLSTAFLAFFPFDGFELSILSIGILSFSVLKISEKIHNGNVCKINAKKMKGGFKND